MKLNIGTKIRELRRRDGRTQDSLAEVLGVTPQAVSRWESGGSYPDLEMIPSIANYFHVSVDELFGYHDDREDKIKSILDSANEIMTKQGYTMYQGCLTDEFEACVNMLRAAAEEFPNEPKILIKLAKALLMWGWNKYGAKGHSDVVTGIIEDDIEYNSKNVFWQEAVRAYEKLLKSNPSPDDRDVAICQLVPLYCRMGEYEKAKKLANEQNAIVICRELLLPMATIGEEKARYQGERIMALLQNLDFAITESVAVRPAVFSSDYGKQILQAVVNLYETIFIDGKCGSWHGNIGRLYLSLVNHDMDNNGSIEDILANFDKAFDHFEESVRVSNEENYDYTAPLVSNLKHLEKSELSPVDIREFWKKKLKFYKDEVIDELHRNPKYAECFK